MLPGLFSKIKRVAWLVASDLRANLPPIAAIVIYYFSALAIFGHVCPSKILLGASCPGCGLTRGSISLLTLRPIRAFSYNPAVYLWVPYLSYLLICRYIFEKKAPYKTALLVILCISTVAIWSINPHRS